MNRNQEPDYAKNYTRDSESVFQLYHILACRLPQYSAKYIACLVCHVPSLCLLLQLNLLLNFNFIYVYVI